MIFKHFPLAAVASATALVALVAQPLDASAQTSTRDVDRPSAQPVNAACSSSFSPYPGLIKCVLYTVPPGKRLVVEMFSYLVATDSDQSAFLITTGRNNPAAAYIRFGPQVYAVTINGGVAVGTGRIYSGAQPMSFYLEENEALAAQVDYTGVARHVQQFNFSGHLVDR